MSEEKQSSGGLGILELMFVVFLFLKLGEIGSVAEWSWWAVTAPLWISTILRLIVAIVKFKLQNRNTNRIRQRIVVNTPKIKTTELPTPEQIKKYKKEKLTLRERIKLWFKSFRKK